MGLDEIISLKNVSKRFVLGRSLGRDTFLGETHWLISLFIKIFKKGYFLTALKDINLSVKKGELCCIVGPNASGKSTLLKIIAGLIKPDTGSVNVCGFNPIYDRDIVMSKILYYSSNHRYSLDYALTVRDQIKFYLKFLGKSTNIFDGDTWSFIKLLDLEKYLDTPIRFLSSGYRQRVSIMRLFLVKRDILLLDEPTIGLDPILCGKLTQFLKKINRERQTTIIVATNRMRLVEELEPDKIVFLRRGEIIVESTFPNILSLMKDKYVIKIESIGIDSGFIKVLRALRDVNEVSIKVVSSNIFEINIFTNNAGVFEEIYRLISDFGLHFRDIYIVEPSIEEIYLRIVGGELYFE